MAEGCRHTSEHKAGKMMIPVLMTGAFLGSLSQNMLASALSAIIDEFSVSALVGQWLTTVYLLMVGVVSALTATLFQRVHTRQLLECSLSLFAAGCLAAIMLRRFGRCSSHAPFKRQVQVYSFQYCKWYLFTFILPKSRAKLWDSQESSLGLPRLWSISFGRAYRHVWMEKSFCLPCACIDRGCTGGHSNVSPGWDNKLPAT